MTTDDAPGGVAATLAPAFRGFPRRGLALIAHVVNDESFAIAVGRSTPPNPSLYLGSALAIGVAHRDRGRERQRRGGFLARSLGAGPVRTTIALTILGMAVATYLTRAPLLLILARQPLRPRLRLWLRLIPLAVLPALAVPMIRAPQGQLALGPDNARLWGALIVVGLAALRANLLLSVAIAVAAVAAIRTLG